MYIDQMKVFASMQPYFFPYIGYFSLFHAASEFQFFDTSQYTQKSWMSRNRIQNYRGVAYVVLPVVKHPHKTPINKIEIFGDDWKRKVVAQLEFYKKKAPYYKQVIELVKDCFNENCKMLSCFNIISTIKVCRYIGLNTKHSVFSKTAQKIETNAPDETLLEKAKAFGFMNVVNPHGAIGFYDVRKYDEAGVKLRFVKNRLRTYDQKNDLFIPGLSIIDVLMFNSPKETLKLVADYELMEGVLM